MGDSRARTSVAAVLVALLTSCGAAEPRSRDALETRAPAATARPAASAPSIETTASGKTLALIEAGAAPRQRLRYRFTAPRTEWLAVEDETVVVSTVEGQKPVTTSLPPTTMKFFFDEKRVNAAGDLEYEGRIDSVDIAPRAGGMRNKLRELTSALVGLRFSGVVSARGINKSADIETPKNMISQATKVYVDRVRQSLLDVTFPLPEQEVGVGARWAVEERMPGAWLPSIRRYEWTLKSASPEAITVEATISERANDASDTFTLGPGIVSKVLAVSAGGTEQSTVSLVGLVGRGTGHWTTSADVAVEGEGRTARVHRTTQTDVTVGPAP